ncbi:MAG: hypothetical protein KatS3mg113_0637 [Planctomycetaceae bacterium]|nr:MAG: hypothetical protein KatS3mg113_0637 [Planctomycetaceae bacterium]
MRAQLVPIKGGQPIIINRDITVIGRARNICDVVIDRNSISKLHCVIVRTDGLLFLRDLGSTNGTRVNGQRVIRGALLPGDELALAGERFRVELGPDSDSPAADKTEEFSLAPASHSPLSHALRSLKDSDSDVRLLDENDLKYL